MWWVRERGEGREKNRCFCEPRGRGGSPSRRARTCALSLFPPQAAWQCWPSARGVRGRGEQVSARGERAWHNKNGWGSRRAPSHTRATCRHPQPHSPSPRNRGHRNEQGRRQRAGGRVVGASVQHAVWLRGALRHGCVASASRALGGGANVSEREAGGRVKARARRLFFFRVVAFFFARPSNDTPLSRFASHARPHRTNARPRSASHPPLGCSLDPATRGGGAPSRRDGAVPSPRPDSGARGCGCCPGSALGDGAGA